MYSVAVENVTRHELIEDIIALIFCIDLPQGMRLLSTEEPTALS